MKNNDMSPMAKANVLLAYIARQPNHTYEDWLQRATCPILFISSEDLEDTLRRCKDSGMLIGHIYQSGDFSLKLADAAIEIYSLLTLPIETHTLG